MMTAYRNWRNGGTPTGQMLLKNVEDKTESVG